MRIEELRLSIGRETLAATRILAGDESPSVVSFHGTGTAAHRGRVRYVLDHLAAGGVSSACFDFSGHGESSGTFETATLRQRAFSVRRTRARSSAQAWGRTSRPC
jgi:alpha-beta hydrolase superfamily lysophospholipase